MPAHEPLPAPPLRYRANLQAEVDSAALYRGLAAAERNEALVELYGRLARADLQGEGPSDDKAQALAERVMSNPGAALDTLAREELGIDPDDLGGSPWVAGVASFFVFSLGALVPVAPFVVLGGVSAVAASALVSAIALAVVGAVVTIFTGRNATWSALRQVIFGLAAAGITYGVGYMLRVRSV